MSELLRHARELQRLSEAGSGDVRPSATPAGSSQTAPVRWPGAARAAPPEPPEPPRPLDVDLVHLHVHTAEGSPGDALSTAEQLAARAAELGQPALAVTDHGSISAWWKLQAACLTHGIRPILGCEFYLAEGDKADRRATVLGRRAYHLTLLAEDNAGRDSIIRLNNTGHRDGYHYHPRVDMRDLRGHAAGVICLSGCIAGPVAQAALSGRESMAHERAAELAEIFGGGRFYLEVQPNDLPEQREANSILAGIGRDLALPLVATGDVHYAAVEQSEAHDLLVCIARRQKVSEGLDTRYAPRQFYMRSAAEMKHVLHELPEAVSNTVEIAARCHADLDLDLALAPTFRTPDGFSPEDHLRVVATARSAGLGFNDAVHVERLGRELDVICGLGFASYFLIVEDLVAWAKSQGIHVGPGRGSVVGSLVARALGITALDPIQHGLLFERFLTPDRVTLPDIDVDFDREHRDEVVEHLVQTYQVFPILTRSYLHTKGALRDAGRAHGVSQSVVDGVAGRVDREIADTGGSADEAGATFFAQNIHLDPTSGKWFGGARGIVGTARSLSRHPSGFIVADSGADMSLVPVQRIKGEIVAAWDMDDVELVGAVKLDILGLSTLAVLRKALARAEVNTAFRDPETWNSGVYAALSMISEGRTTGVFQLESWGMQQLLRRVQPCSFDDLVAAIALHRPGSLNSGQTDLYVQARHGRAVGFPDPRVASMLTDTAGVIVYQEQVMNIAREIAGFSASEADQLRKAVAKKKPDEMRVLMQQLEAGARARGMTEENARALADTITRFGGYGFNKSHAAAYAFLSLQLAWIKVRFPAEFWVARLSVEPSGADPRRKFADYVRAATGDGVRVLPPDVNRSDVEFVVEGTAVRFGLASIAGVGVAPAQAVVHARESAGPFDTLAEFYARLKGSKCANMAVLGPLVYAGALDGLTNGRTCALEELEYVHKHRKRKTPPPPFEPSARPEDLWARLIWEYELLGCPVGTDLTAVFPPEAELDYRRIEYDTSVTVGGRVKRVNELVTRHGSPYVKLRIEGAMGDLTAMLFEHCLGTCPVPQVGDFITVVGVLDERYGTLKVDEVTVLATGTALNAVK